MPASNIPFERLVDLVEGRLPDEQRAELLAQVAASPQASEEVARLTRIIELMRTDDAEDAPPHVVARAARLFRQRAAHEAPTPGPLRRLRAALQFDSARRPLVLGVRSGHTLMRQLLFTSEVRDLDLRIMPSDALWSIAGQVLGSCEGGQVELHGPTFQVQAALNELCEFALPPVPAGTYTLSLRMSDTEIEIVGLDVGG